MEDNLNCAKSKGICTKAELELMSKDELINRVLKLQTHNTQLKNILQKREPNQNGTKIDSKHKRNFDFSKSHQRHILLKFLYLGWDYSGYACQEDTTETIEYYLFEALEKVRLIENRQNANYHRCGRTDKGVTAFSQVVSLDVRSKFNVDEQLKPENISAEMDYCSILNSVLPPNIKCIAWMPSGNKEFSARFDCKMRMYHYHFPRGTLNIGAMQDACQYLLGSHDFRNLCKMDVGNGVTQFIRNIHSARILPNTTHDGTNKDGYEMYYLEIVGNAFLWHQIRCIAAVLFLVGDGSEEPTIVRDLLDISKYPNKPQYNMASYLPLSLFECRYAETSDKPIHEETIDGFKWQYTELSMKKLISSLQSQWTQEAVKAALIREMIEVLESGYIDIPNSNIQQNLSDSLVEGCRKRMYQKLSDRPTCESLDYRLDRLAKKQKLM